MVNNFWENKKILITGDTGFKGSWLTCLLLNLGSLVYGISLKANKSNILNNALNKDSEFKKFILNGRYHHYDLDIRKKRDLKKHI